MDDRDIGAQQLVGSLLYETNGMMPNPRITLITTVAVVASVAIATATAQTRKSDWQHLAKSGKFVLLYNPAKTTRLPHGVIKAWVKQIPAFDSFANGEAKKEYIQLRRKNGLSVLGYENWSHALSLYEFKCDDKKLRSISTVDYDDDGNVLDSHEFKEAWTDVIPESIGEAMLTAFCRQRR